MAIVVDVFVMLLVNRVQASVTDSPVRSISHPPRQPVDIKMESVYITY